MPNGEKLPDFTENLPSVAETATWIWENQEFLEKWAGRLGNLGTWLGLRKTVNDPTEETIAVDESARRVLILGPGGVGKTTLGRLLSNDGNLARGQLARYDESLGQERFKINESLDVEAIVLPGQSHRREVFWQPHLADLADGRFRGVIVFGAFGYHAIGESSYKSHRLSATNKTKDEFLESFVEVSRQDEIETLSQIADQIAKCREPIWLATIITKQDLWWAEQAGVEAYYRDNAYGAKVAELSRKKSGDKFRHEFAFVSLVIRNFVTGRGELLKKTTAGYDQEMQLSSFSSMCEKLEALQHWEASL